jgi:hypothetical protein
MLQLRTCRGRMASAHRCSFHRRRIVADSVWPSVECNMSVVHDGIVSNDRLIHVRVVDDGPIHAHHRGVVCKSAATPFAAYKANPHVAESVVDSAVISDAIAPVAIVEYIPAVTPAPPWRSPKRARIWCRHPLARNPVVAIIAVGPVTGYPHPAFLRTYRLLVYGQNRRCNVDRDQYTRKRRHGNKQQH